MIRNSRQRDALDLDIDVLGQRLDGHAAARRLVGEPLGVLLVHSLASTSAAAADLDAEPSSYNVWRGAKTYDEVGHVGDEDVHLDDLLDAGAGGGEHGLQVLDAGGRLLLDGALDQVTLGVAGDLARAVDGRRSLDGVGL